MLIGREEQKENIEREDNKGTVSPHVGQFCHLRVTAPVPYMWQRLSRAWDSGNFTAGRWAHPRRSFLSVAPCGKTEFK